MAAVIIIAGILLLACCALLIKYLQATESKALYDEKLRQLIEKESQHNQRGTNLINDCFKSNDSLSNWLITDCGETAVRCAMCGMEVPVITRGNINIRHQLHQLKWKIRTGRPYCPSCIEKEKEFKAKQSGVADNSEKTDVQQSNESIPVDKHPVNSVLDE